jgi:hypothetical protein
MDNLNVLEPQVLVILGLQGHIQAENILSSGALDWPKFGNIFLPKSGDKRFWKAPIILHLGQFFGIIFLQSSSSSSRLVEGDNSIQILLIYKAKTLFFQNLSNILCKS